MRVFLPVLLLSALILTAISAGLSEKLVFSQKGKASYYGREFEGRKTANGERFRNADFTAAHRTLPFNTFLRVTNLKNGLSITVRINDRGPYVRSRIIDLSEAAARRIGSYQKGLAQVKIERGTILNKTQEIDSIFRFNEVLDCLGNKDELSGYSLSLWRTKDIIHMLYVANELYLHDDIEKVLIAGTGMGTERLYHLILTGYSGKEAALNEISRMEKKGFMEIKLFKRE